VERSIYCSFYKARFATIGGSKNGLHGTKVTN
jgi:hypothetical protein